MTVNYEIRFAANPADFKKYDTEEIRKQFNLPEDISIIPAVAKDKTGIFEAFEVLIDKITGGI